MPQRSSRERYLLAGLFGAAGLWLIARSGKTLSDPEALAHMLIAETSFSRDKNEMAQIVFVAINRAKKYGVSIADVVTPPGTPVWNTGSPYRSRFDGAMRNVRYDAALAFANEVLAGKYKNGGYTSFVHPSGMPAPPCSANRVASATNAGSRCLPTWAVNGKTVGGAVFV